MLVTLPVVAISWALGAGGILFMSGAVEYGVIPVLAIREAVREGFPDGLGPLSEDYGQGIAVLPDGEQIGRYLFLLSALFDDLKWMQGKIFHMKVPEARDVFDLVEAINANGHMVNLTKALAIPPDQRNEDYDKMVEFFKSQLLIALIPLNKALKTFPAYRTSQAQLPA